MRLDMINPTPCSSAPGEAADAVARWQTGVATLDSSFGGGFAFGRVHEFFAASAEDASASAGFVLALAVCAVSNGRPIMWLRGKHAARSCGVVHAPGWVDLGIAPEACLFVLVTDEKALLRAGVDALRCGQLGAVVIEGWGRMPALDLTASRRLSLAAEASAVPLLLLRVDAQPVPSAAETRWRVAAAPSRALPGKAPGVPCFDLELLRCRSGPAGKSWRLEWDRDQTTFRDAALPGALVPVPLGRPAAGAGAGSLSQAA